MTLLEAHRRRLDQVQPLGIAGQVNCASGLTVSVSDFPAPIGAACAIASAGGQIAGRVIGLGEHGTVVMPLGSMSGIARGDRVELVSSVQEVAVGPAMLGRVLDGLGRPIDGLGPMPTQASVPLWPAPLAAMQRRRIDTPLSTGVRVIDSLLTVARGQRMGIFSGSGVGKSVLMGMISRYTAADVCVIALIGERGREVREFVEKDLGPAGLKRSVVVAATGDEPPLVRVQAGAAATAICEYFRDRGCNVLLLMDSLTRLGWAQRQIGLVSGEPPASKGYTPSVFNLLPQLLERAGCTDKGSITGFYTVLLEGDDLNEPVADAARAVTDGHIYLSREMANRGHYPAVDVLRSVSRVMSDVVDGEHRQAARDIHRLIALYSEIEDLVTIGAYQSGANVEYDLAIKSMPLINNFLAQAVGEHSGFALTCQGIKDLQRQVGMFKHAVAARSGQLGGRTVGDGQWVRS